MLKKFFRGLAVIASVTSCFILSFCATAAHHLPDNYKITPTCPISVHKFLTLSTRRDSTITADSRDDGSPSYSAEISFMSVIPIKKVSVQKIDDVYVMPGGDPFGVKLFTKGVIIVGISDVKTSEGVFNPAKQAGLQKGDIILTVNKREVSSNEELIKLVEDSKGAELTAEVIRNGIKYEAKLFPARGDDGTYKLGIWVRDSSAGIGTVTFWDEKTHLFGGLGHGICDIDTGELLPLSHGDLIKVKINDISKGIKGNPGELKAYFIECEPIGKLIQNTYSGIYGKYSQALSTKEHVKIAMKQQVKEGKAQILTTVSGTTPEAYDIDIIHLNYNEELASKNMVIKITDEKLLSQTGGIIQGMSGSPILQNGMLVGAITHVFVNDPQKGYAIFAENMISKIQEIDITDYKKIS